MPFKRKTLSELQSIVTSDIENGQKDIGSLLRFSNMRVIGNTVAGMSHLQYGYLDYIAKQATPYTATDEYLAAWGATRKIFRYPPTAATCKKVLFEGKAGVSIQKGTKLNRSDGYQYTVDNGLTINSNGESYASITAVLKDPFDDITCGGKDGNIDAGTLLTFDEPITGLSNQVTTIDPITGGSDVENEEDFRSRVLHRYQNTPQGGSNDDYISWALSIPGVTRAWIKRRIIGVGSVGVYFMMDGNSNNGFPVGSDGISNKEDWGAYKATGDQLTVANYIYDFQPVTALVWVCSPIAKKINFEIRGISSASDSVKKELHQAIENVFFSEGELAGMINLSSIIKAISNVDGTNGFILNTPNSNISLGTGELPSIGVISYV
ncbi:baseplate J/gp47 family protein (plasmid) [Orbus sturtevantii]|uniref:baseplate J/gp47 family protein n=1 Tax=Orbus sturtevantii TaxID=3074109 RepID=UPI00370D0220